MILQHLKKLVMENQIMVVLLALLLGVFFPGPLKPLNQFSTQLLILVFFFSSLRLSMHELLEYAKDWKMLVIANAFMLLVIPFALYYPFLLISKDWAFALLILGAMPTGMTIALVAEFFGGKTSLALLVTTTTSLLAPFTIPLVFKIAIGQSVPIPMFQMFWSLFLTIVLPFVLAMLVKRAAPKSIDRHDGLWRQLSVVAFGILIAGIVADTSGGAMLAFRPSDIIILICAMLSLGVLTWAAYESIPWRAASERLTVALCMVYLNNTLALFVANRYFKELNAVPKLILLLLAVNMLLPPIKLMASRLNKPNTCPIT